MRYFNYMLFSILSIFAPIEPVILTVLALVLADFVLGIIAAKKRGEALTSAGFRRTITKLVIFEITILAAFLTEKYLTGSIMPVQKIVSCFIGLTELTSITENLNEISGNSLLGTLIQKLGSKNLRE